MNYSERQADPRRHLVGIATVILFHILLVWALASGLARKVVEVIKPIETKVIEEAPKPPPPPPEVVVPPPPQMNAPPPPFIPPPEVTVATPPPPAPTITTTTNTPPPTTEIKPVVPQAPPAPPAPPAPAVLSAAVVCSNYQTAMGDAAFPKEAVRQGLEKGEAMVLFTLSASGEIKNVQVERASNPIFGRAAIRVVSEFKCQGQGRDVQVRVPFSYKLE